MVNKSQKILILSWGERIWSTNIHGSDLKRVGGLSNFSKGCCVFALLFSPVTLVTLPDVIFNVLSHSWPIVPNTPNFKCPFPPWVCCENGVMIQGYDLSNQLMFPVLSSPVDDSLLIIKYSEIPFIFPTCRVLQKLSRFCSARTKFLERVIACT